MSGFEKYLTKIQSKTKRVKIWLKTLKIMSKKAKMWLNQMKSHSKYMGNNIDTKNNC